MIRVRTKNKKNFLFIFTLFVLFVATFLSIFLVTPKSSPIEAQTCPSGCEYNSPLGVCTGPGGCRYEGADNCYSSEFYAGQGYCCDNCEPDCGACDSCTPVTPTGYTATNTSCSTTTASCTRYDDCGECGTTTLTYYLLRYTLTYTAGTGGTLSGTTSQSICRGSSGTAVTAVPNGGYAFSQWSDGSTANPRTNTNVTADGSFTANFVVLNTAPTAPTSLLAEGATNPVGVTDTTPEFSAIFNDGNAGNTGTYYEIEVNTNNTFTGTVMWDSGQVAMSATAIGARSPDISYAGTALTLNGTTYYWRIRFWDNNGAVGTWSAVANFTMNTAPTAPTSLLTEGATNPVGVTDTTPEFSAIFNDPNSGNTATYYEIEVNTNNTFTGTVMWDTGQVSMTAIAIGTRSSDISYAGTALTLSGTTYYWRIRFTDNYGTVGAWSTVSTFQMNTAPTTPSALLVNDLTNPTRLTDITPDFKATYSDPDSDNMAYYEIEVNTNNTFTGTIMWDTGQVASTPVASGSQIPAVTYAGTALTLSGTTYYWRIRFTDSYGTVGGWSSTATFRMNTTPGLPTSLQTEGLTNPTRVTDTTPEFSAIFNDSDTGDTATYYEIEVNTNNTFTGTVMWDSNQTAITPIAIGARSSDISYAGTTLTLNGITYYWRIRFWDNSGTVSDWSTTSSFGMNTTPGLPTSLQTEGLTNPTRVTDITPEFSAIFNDSDTGDTATYYEIEVNSNATFTGTVMWDSNQTAVTPIPSNSRSPEIPYAGTAITTNGTTYYWRIRFWDSSGSVSNWSSTNTFRTLDIPVSPTTLSGTGLSTTSIRWSFTDNANGEDGIRIYDEENNLVKTCVGENLTYCDETGLLENKQYTRYVKAYNSEAESQASNSDSVYTLISVPEIQYQGTKTSNSITISAPQPVNGGELYFDCEGSCDTNINTWTTTNIANVTSLSNNTGYTFRVKARNNDQVETAYSFDLTIYTHSSVPVLNAGPLSTTSISLSGTGVNNLSSGDSGIFFECVSINCSNGIQDWIQSTTDVAINLSPNTQYTFRVKSRNFAGEESAYSSEVNAYTLAVVPSISSVNTIGSTQMTVGIDKETNPNLTELLIQETFTGMYVNLTTGELVPTAFWGHLEGATPSITVTGLQSGTTYTFRVKGRNTENIETAYSSTVSSTSSLSSISALTPTVDSKNQITWNISAYTDSVLGIKVYNENGDLIKTCLGSDITSCTEDSLIPNTTYVRKFKIYNNLAESAFSNTVSASTFAEVPSLIEITSEDFDAESVNIQIDPLNNSSSTKYLIEEKNTGLYFNSETQLLQESPHYSTYTQLGSLEGKRIYGLIPNSTYVFRAKAQNIDLVDTNFSNEVTFTTLVKAPSIVSVEAIDTTTLKIVVNNQGNINTTLYTLTETKSGKYVTPSTNTLSSEILWKTYEEIGGNTGITLQGLTPNTQYSFCVKAKNINNIETECSQVVSTYTLSNATTLSARVISSSSIEVVVNKNNNPSNTRYQIVDINTNGNITNDGTLTNTAVIHTDERISQVFKLNTLPPNTTYNFRVRSINSEEVYSSWSEDISVTTWANTPKDLTFEIVGGTSGRIKFDRNLNPTATKFAIQDKISGKYLDYSTQSLVDTPVWGSYASWGNTSGVIFRNLQPGVEYSFRAKAINSANVETNYIESNTGKTYSIIVNKPEDISTILLDNTDIDVSSLEGAQTGVQKIRVLTEEYIIADLPISFTDNRDWSNAIIKSSPKEGKSVVKINESHGLTDKFTLYVIKKDNDNAFRICPEAISLEEVNKDCPNGILYTGNFPQKKEVEGSNVTVSQASISGVMYWIADGLSGTGGQGEEISKEIVNIPSSSANLFKNITESVEGALTKALDSLNDTPLGNIQTEDLTTVAATTTAVTVSVGFASIFGNIGQLGYSISQIFVNILSTLGFRRKRLPAGYIYDSITRAPLQQAIVRVYDLSQKLVDTSVTDGQGKFRLGLNTGDYILDIKKRDFKFPSRLILGKEDYPFSNVYHGEKVRLVENEINIVIPLDPEEDIATKKILTVLRSGISLILPLLNCAIFLLGLTIAIYVYNKESNLINLVLLLLYIPTVFVLIKSISGRGKKLGKVTYPNGTPASNITLVLKDKDFEKIVAKRITDEKGRYSFDLNESGNFAIESADNSIRIIDGKTTIKSKGKIYINTRLKVERA